LQGGAKIEGGLQIRNVFKCSGCPAT
jgi:hypothetical protein